MRYLCHLLLVGSGMLCFLTSVGFQQQALPGHSPQTAAKSKDPSQDQLIRVHVRLVPVTVIVTDAKDRPVTDLKAEDFQLLENGKPQEIRHFVIQRLAAAAPEPVRPLVRDGEFAPQGARTFLFLMGYGRIQLPFNSVDALIRFVREDLLPQDRVALFAYNRATQFTTDHEKIAQFLERFKKLHEWVAALMEQRMSGLAAIYGSRELPKECLAYIDEIFADPGGSRPRHPSPAQVADKTKMTTEADRATETLLRKAVVDEAAKAEDPGAALRQAMMQFDTLAAQSITDLPFSEYAANFGSTMDDLQNIYTAIDYLRYMDGEKHLVFFTPNGIFLPRAEYDDNIVAFANDARVAIDTFQTGGLSRGGAGWETRLPIQTLRTISELTGGQSSLHQRVETTLNRLNQTTRASYLLGYYPKDENWDGKYRRIEVKVNRPGLTLAFRHGYYARDSMPPMDAAELLSYRRITAAGARIAEINDLAFQVNAAQIDPLAPEIKVDLSVAPQDIDLTVINGLHTGELRVAVFYADKAGNYLGDVWKTVALKLREESYSQYLQTGIPFTVSVPAKAPMQILKVIIYDLGSDRLGSKLIKIK
ncbi:MAG: VWA domain-containing protein [Acidobacteriia bacterium]|nr:VWA domain-containing protein [Terriglobia bacterium]